LGAEHDGDGKIAEFSLILIAALVALGKVWTRSSPILGWGGGRAAVGARMALRDRVAGVASRPFRLASFAGGARVDVALPNSGFGARGAFSAFRSDVAGNADSCISRWPRRRRGFLRRPHDDRAFAEQFRSLTAKP
jgi:hypothetical protein